MSLIEYHKSIGREIDDMKNRFRLLTGQDFHRLSDGKHKESIIKNVLSRHLPKNVSAKNGFVKFNQDDVSSEIDILLYSNDRPTLFENDDVVVITPHGVIGGIEVKTNLASTVYKNALYKLADNAEQTRRSIQKSRWENLAGVDILNQQPAWFALFSYSANISDELLLAELDIVANGKFDRVVNCMSLGPNKFVRFWYDYRSHPYSTESFTGWKLYELEELSFSYFISNMIWQDKASTSESQPWFALESKEVRMVAEKSFTRK